MLEFFPTGFLTFLQAQSRAEAQSIHFFIFIPIFILYNEGKYVKKKLDRVRAACRKVASEEAMKYKRKNLHWGTTVSAISGKLLVPEDKPEVDHWDLTFAEAFELWISDKNIDVLNGYVGYPYKFTKPELENDWRQFHNSHTKFRLVTRTENRTVCKKKLDKNREIHYLKNTKHEVIIDIEELIRCVKEESRALGWD